MIIDISTLEDGVNELKKKGIIDDNGYYIQTKPVKEKVLEFDGDVVFIDSASLYCNDEDSFDDLLDKLAFSKMTSLDAWSGGECLINLHEKDTDNEVDGLFLATETDGCQILSLEDYLDILDKLGFKDLVKFDSVGNYEFIGYGYDSYVCFKDDDYEKPIFALKNFKGIIKIFDFGHHVPDEYVIDEASYRYKLGEIDGVNKITGDEIHYIIENA